MKVKKGAFIAIVLGILVVISAVQAFQLGKMKTSIEDDGLSVKSAKTSTPARSTGGDSSGGEAPALPSNLENLPQMVGGC